MTFDREAFEHFLLVDLDMEPITVGKRLERLDLVLARGFDLDAFTSSPARALVAGRSYLAERRKGGASIDSYNHDVRLLVNLAKHLDYATVRFRMQKPRRAQLRSLRDEQVRDVLDYHADEREADLLHRALLVWALKSGMRPSEIAQLERRDLDPRLSRFHVRKPAKDGLVRWLPIEPWIWSPKRPFGAYLKWHAEVTGGDVHAPLWITRRLGGGRGQSARARAPKLGEWRACKSPYLRKILNTVGRTTGVRPLNFNVTRHTRGTELRRKGWDLLSIKTYLGHSSVQSTEIYAEVRPDDLDLELRRRPGADFFHDTFGV